MRALLVVLSFTQGKGCGLRRRLGSRSPPLAGLCLACLGWLDKSRENEFYIRDVARLLLPIYQGGNRYHPRSVSYFLESLLSFRLEELQRVCAHRKGLIQEGVDMVYDVIETAQWSSRAS